MLEGAEYVGDAQEGDTEAGSRPRRAKRLLREELAETIDPVRLLWVGLGHRKRLRRAEDVNAAHEAQVGDLFAAGLQQVERDAHADVQLAHSRVIERRGRADQGGHVNEDEARRELRGNATESVEVGQIDGERRDVWQGKRACELRLQRMQVEDERTNAGPDEGQEKPEADEPVRAGDDERYVAESSGKFFSRRRLGRSHRVALLLRRRRRAPW